MITVDALVDLVRRHLLDGAPIAWSKTYPDGPAVDLETAERCYSVGVVRGWLRVERAPWVEAVVVARRDDRDVEGPRPRDVFLVGRDGTMLHLDNRADTAALGARLHSDLDPHAYAEILVRFQWPAALNGRVLADPAPRTWYENTDLCLLFTAERDVVHCTGAAMVTERTQWSVRVPVDAPAEWLHRSHS